MKPVVGFFGTPDIASYCLKKLNEKYNVAFAVTAEDKPAGRRQQITMPPVKTAALESGIDVLQPVTLKDGAFMQTLKAYNADIFVVVAYGKIIPADIFELPLLKTINLHPSMLPKYRGAAPIPWAIINGEDETGVTVQLINERLDAGDIVQQEIIPLDNSITTGELYERVLPLSADLLVRSIDLLASGGFKPVIQDESEATYCKKIDRDTAHIDWTQSASAVHNLVRGLNPKPVAWTTFRDRNMKIWKTALFSEDVSIRPGEILVYRKKRILAGTGDGVIEILSLQPETRKVMDNAAFINGYHPSEGECFV